MIDNHILLMPITVLLLLFASCTPQHARSEPAVKKTMQELTAPAADGVFAVANTAPNTAQDWLHVKHHALNLVAAGEWLVSKPLNKDQAIWRQAANTLLTAAKAAVAAANANDVEAVMNAGNDLYAACASCHAQYLTPPKSKSH